MKNPKIIFAAILGVVVCFAGYNLWSYFKEQQVIQAEEGEYPKAWGNYAAIF